MLWGRANQDHGCTVNLEKLYIFLGKIPKGIHSKHEKELD